MCTSEGEPLELLEFLHETQSEVRSQIGERLSIPGESYPHAESVFADVVMQHMAEIGMTFESAALCHYTARVGNAHLRLSGYAISDDADQMDLFVSLYEGVDEITPISDTETKTAAEQCLRFLVRCVQGRLASTMDESNDAYPLALTIQESYQKLDQIRLYVLTDRKARTKNFQAREIQGKTVKLEVMDIERLHRHWSEGKPRDEIVVNFEEICGNALPCVYVPGDMADYDYALTVMPGEALRFVYDKYGERLLEANVRSFLSVTSKINRGIHDTLRNAPERFMAYNNGIVLIVDELRLGRAPDGAPGILWLKGMQIVNGGQTTASLYFTKRRYPEVNLGAVKVPAKIIVLKAQDSGDEEQLITDISKYANSQNAVPQSDLSANKPFHVELEKLSRSTYCPDGVSRWFYERTAGSYRVMLDREGATPARLQQLRDSIPNARKITKTDLAKYLNAWDEEPHVVSLGAQKNFEKFMDKLSSRNGQEDAELPDVPTYKRMIARAILFKTAHSLIRPSFPAFQANITNYMVSLVAHCLGARLDLDRIWLQQGLSPQLQRQIQAWAVEVNAVLHRTAGGRMISEWAKKPECWDAVVKAHYSAPLSNIPELH